MTGDDSSLLEFLNWNEMEPGYDNCYFRNILYRQKNKTQQLTDDFRSNITAYGIAILVTGRGSL
jgi:hypothetical protein